MTRRVSHPMTLEEARNFRGAVIANADPMRGVYDVRIAELSGQPGEYIVTWLVGSL